jgi:hypothetical protein
MKDVRKILDIFLEKGKENRHVVRIEGCAKDSAFPSKLVEEAMRGRLLKHLGKRVNDENEAKQ